MIRTLLWKEYRELRTTAVALTVFAIGLLFSLQAISLSAPEASTYAAVIVCLVWMAGLVAGAQPFAGEFENRTQNWLDVQPAGRSRVGRTKIAVVVVYLAFHAIILCGLGVGMMWLEQKYFPITILAVIAFGFSGLGCGLYASSLARSPLMAIGYSLIVQAILLTVIGFVALLLAILLQRPHEAYLLVYAAFICSPLPLILAIRHYSRPDRRRLVSLLQHPNTSGRGWRSLIWLSWRQSKSVFWILTSAGLVASIGLRLARAETLWPAIGLVFGIIAGVGTFAADRPGDAHRFFGDRRVPFGRTWIVKSTMRFAILLIPVALHFIIGLIAVGAHDWDKFRKTDMFPQLLRDQFWTSIHPSFLLLGPLYGFALGQSLGMACRKGAIAVVLAVMLGFGVLVIWWPSVIVTGLHVWQWIVPPLLMIAATRWVMRPWAAGRLGTWRPAFQLIAVAALSIIAMIGGLWYRVAEVPEPHDPFDIVAFKKSLPSPEHNETGRILAALFQKYADPFAMPAGVAEESNKLNRMVIIQMRAAEAVSKHTWPTDDAELNRLLDDAFANPWFDDLREAVALPLGMVNSDVLGSVYHASNLLNYRALQLVSRGQTDAAFDIVFLKLALSRHLQSKATGHGFRVGSHVETSALGLLAVLAELAVDRADLLEKSLARLIEHAKAVPPLMDTLRIEYVQTLEYASIPNFRKVDRNQSQWDHDAKEIALQVPWEQQRTRAILAMAYAGFLRTYELPFAEAQSRVALDYRPGKSVWWPFMTWTSPSSDPIQSAKDTAKMCRLLQHSRWEDLSMAPHLLGGDIADRTHRNAAQLQLALAIYQHRHVTPATELNKLVPEIMSELPRDPYNDEPIHYRVSQGETIKPWNRNSEGFPKERTTSPGQGLLWSVGPDLVDNNGLIDGPAIWWLRGMPPYDIVFLVPVVKKP